MNTMKGKKVMKKRPKKEVDLDVIWMFYSKQISNVHMNFLRRMYDILILKDWYVNFVYDVCILK